MPPELPTPLASRLEGYGTTIFSEMTALAQRYGAVNLGQGFPDDDPPERMVAAAHAALDAGHHQYAPGPGVEALREAIATHQAHFYGSDLDPEIEITVTFGATEAISVAMLALCEPGDEVILLDPAYDAYPVAVTLAHGIARRVPLLPPQIADPTARWRLDIAGLEAAITGATRLILVNTPHNPTGAVFDDQELGAIARLCLEHDLIAVTDEVYEHLIYEGTHRPLATFPGMRERTVTISSASKSLSATGWKVGWVCASPAITTAVRTVKQFTTFSGGTPLQHAVATTLAYDDGLYTQLAEVHRRRRDLLATELSLAGASVITPAGTYFLTADVSAFGYADGATFCRNAPEQLGIAAVPVSAFVADPSSVAHLVRFAFCKPDEVLREGMRRLHAQMKVRTPTRG